MIDIEENKVHFATIRSLHCREKLLLDCQRISHDGSVIPVRGPKGVVAGDYLGGSLRLEQCGVDLIYDSIRVVRV